MSTQKKVPPELDQIIDKVFGYKPSKVLDEPSEVPAAAGAWSVSVDDIFKNGDVRLDATHFDPKTAGAVQELRESGIELEPLSNLALVELRSQFTRIWARDHKHGIPYLNATDLLSLLALGIPAGGYRYLSHATETNINSLIIREGWLLMTCSGTIGRVFYVPKRLDGWAATHDLIRVIPKKNNLAGYLYAWLSNPVAQSQILSYTHGGQIDHVTDDQVAEVLVPRLSPDQVKNIHNKVIKALRARERAIQTLSNVW